MFPEMNKSIIRRWYEEVVNEGHSDVSDELFIDDYVDHDPPSPTEVWPRGPEGARQSLAAYRTAFPDLHFTIESMIAEGDQVAVRYVFDGTHRGTFLGIPATGTQVRITGIALWHVVGQKIMECWSQFDLLDFIQQVGSWPQPEQPTRDTPAELGPIV
jgi:steroid delta-isomerase-like uncharacterized protein